MLRAGCGNEEEEEEAPEDVPLQCSRQEAVRWKRAQVAELHRVRMERRRRRREREEVYTKQKVAQKLERFPEPHLRAALESSSPTPATCETVLDTPGSSTKHRRGSRRRLRRKLLAADKEGPTAVRLERAVGDVAPVTEAAQAFLQHHSRGRHTRVPVLSQQRSLSQPSKLFATRKLNAYSDYKAGV